MVEDNDSHTVCRLCLGESSVLIYVFECKGNLGWTAADAIIELLRLQVSSDDIYPQCVCLECMGKLEEFKSFKQQCKKNKALLDRAYAAKRGLVRDEALKGRSNVRKKGADCLDSRDNGVLIEGDPLDVTNSDVKPEVEGDPSQLNEESPPEAVESLNEVYIDVKDEPEDESEQPLSPKSEVCIDDTYISGSANVSATDGNSSNNATLRHSSLADFPESCATCYDKKWAISEVNVNESVDLCLVSHNWVSDDGLTCSYPTYLPPKTQEQAAKECMPPNKLYSKYPSKAVRWFFTFKEAKDQLLKAVKRKDNCSEAEPNARRTLLGKRKGEGFNVTSYIDIIVDGDKNKRKIIKVLPNVETPCLGDSFSGPDGLPILKCDPECTPDVKSDFSYTPGPVQPENIVITMDVDELQDDSTNSNDDEYENTGTLEAPTTGQHYNLSCDECGTAFNDKFSLQEHLECHSIGRNNVSDGNVPLVKGCNDPVVSGRYHYDDVEDVSFRKKGDVDLDFKPEERFFCKLCKKEFGGRRNLNAHLKIHEGVKRFSCDVCNKQFLRREHLKVHSVTHTGDRPYRCDDCGKGFARMNKLTLHLRVHSGEKPFKCPHCDRGFSRSDALKQHERTHSGEKPYVCGVCGRGFAHSSDLKCHEGIHSKDKPYKCNQCERAFSQKRDLRKHEIIHSGVKPFKCDQCSEEFFQNNQLKHHKLLHSGEKPHKCGHCGKGFTKATDLRKHEKLHSGIKPFGCPTCHKRFPRNTSLKRHLLTHSTSKDC